MTRKIYIGENGRKSLLSDLCALYANISHSVTDQQYTSRCDCFCDPSRKEFENDDLPLQFIKEAVLAKMKLEGYVMTDEQLDYWSEPNAT